MMGCEWDRTSASLTKAKHLYYRRWPRDTTPAAQQKREAAKRASNVRQAVRDAKKMRGVCEVLMSFVVT